MNIENVSSLGAMIGGSFFGGILIGYALKKVVKIAAVIVGLFFVGLVLTLNLGKLQTVSQNTLTTLANATTQIPGFNNDIHTGALSNVGIPLTGSMVMGFAIGFIKG